MMPFVIGISFSTIEWTSWHWYRTQWLLCADPIFPGNPFLAFDAQGRHSSQDCHHRHDEQ